MRCPKCGSDDIFIQVVTENSLKNAHHGILWWLFVGWWWVPFKWLFLTVPALLAAIFIPKKQNLVSREKTICICQRCAHRWEMDSRSSSQVASSHSFSRPVSSAVRPETVPARASASENTFVVIDVETPNRRNDRLSSISITRMEGARIGSTISSLINPEVPFDDFNVELTGISELDVRTAPTFPAFWPNIKNALSEGTFVAHNARFDLSVLCKACQAYGIAFPEVRYIDTLTLVQELLPGLDSYKLNAVCQYLTIPLNHHHADSDSLACAKILQWAFNVKGIDPEKYTRYYSAVKESTPSNSRRRKLPAVDPSETTRRLNELLMLLKGIIADNQVTREEVLLVRDWLNDHQELAGNYPYDQINEAIIDAIRGKEEKPNYIGVLALCQTLIDPIRYAKRPEDIELEGKTVCITGDFKMGEAEKVEQWLVEHGAVVKERVVKSLDYLIVGDLGSQTWSAGNYGNKVKRAMEFRFRGAGIQLIRECDLMELVGSGVTKTASLNSQT